MTYKMKFMYRIYIVIGLVILSSCGTNKKKDSEIDWSEVEMVNETSGAEEYDFDDESYEELVQDERPVYQAAETIYTDLIHTKLEVSFDWSKSWMLGKATITAKPHFYASDSLFLDAKGMEIKKINIGAQTLNFKYADNQLRIKLDKMYTRNDKYNIVIEYIAKPDERKTSGSEAITSDKGLYFINPKGEDPNKMPQIWTQGETEASSVWFPTIDAPNVKTTEEIYITVDNKFATLSNGKLMSSIKNVDGTRTDYWKQDLPHAPYLFMMGIGEFKVVKDFYTRPNGTKMEVNYYVEPAWEQSAKAIFGETPKMIEFFSKLTGVEYPWDKYSQIVVREYVSGAMENTGAVVFGDYAYKNARELLDDDDNSTIAHELFHHWFGDLVTAESWSNLTLNESFANYSQYLWDEFRYGIDEADYNAEKEADGYFQSADNGTTHDLVWFEYENQEQMFDAHSYNKGGRILHMLRNHLGDEAFFAGLKNYLNTNKFKAAEFTQLRLAFEEVSGQDLNWFFNQWYLDEGHPVISVSQSLNEETSQVELFIHQETLNGTIFRMPLEIAIHDEAGVTIHPIVFEQQSTSFIFPVTGAVKTIIFDNQHMLLANVTDDKPMQQYVNQFYVGKRYADRRDALLLGIDEQEPLTTLAEKMVLDALKDPFWAIRNLAIDRANLLSPEAKTQASEIVKNIALTDPKSAVRATAITFLQDKITAEELEKLALSMIGKDQSYSVLSAALGALSSTNPDLAMTEAKKLETENSSKMLSGIAQLYASQGTEKEMAFFEKVINENKLNGLDALFAMNSMTIYLTRQSVELQSKAPGLYKKELANGGIYITMFLPQNVDYMIKMVSDQMEKTKAEIKAYETNKDPLYADQARKKLKQQQAIVDELTVFYAEINVEK